MGQIENMRLEDVEVIGREIEKLKKENPDLEFKTFPMEDLDFAKRLTVLEEKMDKILIRLHHIFGEYVLINGRFQEMRLPPSR